MLSGLVLGPKAEQVINVQRILQSLLLARRGFFCGRAALNNTPETYRGICGQVFRSADKQFIEEFLKRARVVRNLSVDPII